METEATLNKYEQNRKECGCQVPWDMPPVLG